MKIKTKLRLINEKAGNISMYVGLIFVFYSMYKENDFSSEPAVTLVILISLLLFGLFRFISFRYLISDIRNNSEPFITTQIDNRK